MIYTTQYISPVGILEISANEYAIVSVLFVNQSEIRNLKIIKNSVVTEICIQQLDEYFEGLRKNFTVQCEPHGTDFQIKVWQLLKEIPYGRTITYKSQAMSFGNLKAIRAIASCNGKNPLAILVPCHRVLGSNGDLTGYAGGLQNKKWLLEHEQKFTKTAVVQQKLFETN